MEDKLNILYIHCHDAGRYLDPYGHSVGTPNIQAFTNEATLFRKAFCNNPTCSPSRACLLTGQYAHQSGMLGLNHRGFFLKDYRQHLGHILRKTGYKTVLSGVQHELEPHVDDVYEKNLNHNAPVSNNVEDCDACSAEKAARWIEDYDASDPFFMACGFFYPHRPFPGHSEDINPDNVESPRPLPDDPAIRKDMAQYMTAAREMDRCFGRVLRALEHSRHAERTIVLFTTDHGIAFPYMKCNLNDSGIGVSMILDFPGNPLRGKCIDSLVSHIDVFPTICDLIGMEHPEWLQGTSLMPLFRIPDQPVRKFHFAEVNYHAGYEPMRCVRTNRYKLIRHFGNEDTVNPVNIDAGSSKSFMLDHQLLQKSIDPVQLYDLALDPNEGNNLAEDESFTAIRSELEVELADWMQATDDPLLKGPIPLPEGAIMNPRHVVDPSHEEIDLITGPWSPEE